MVAMAALGAGCGGRTADVATPPRQRAVVEPVVAESGVLVDVSGQVRRPGVYRLKAGARVHEAIAAAGGIRPGAELSSINRAAVLVDGQQVAVGVRSDGSSTASAASGAAPTVSINAGDAAALDALPGIGPVTAQRIVAEREANGPFASVDDLDRVPGIGPATIETLRTAASI